MEEELAALAGRMEGMLAELRGITADQRAVQEIERVDDQQAVARLIADAVASSYELRAMHPIGTARTGREEQRSRRDVLEALQRGMTMRTIVHRSVLDHPGKLARLRELHAAGDLHRVIGEPIQQLLIFDRAVAFVRITPVDNTPGALVVRQQSLIAAFVDLFEQTWAKATDVSEPPDTIHRLTPREMEVLALIAEGRSNGGVARALSITEAAVGKHVASIFAKLDLPASEDGNRRVLAVLAYLRGGVR